uniref:Uncharacterized protein n=1 Tax=Noctiluca scintillans TaxID=2966 RepID=A0A7S1FIM4_NOCSC|mmetsp:Transcript_7068/g.19388  ORF Transcript_7068/g.19388 Transcript_7068/m.19388 type:complete len:223 (+) Transcript_7068:92-760(+)|eukprot:CAMPEP_0194548468 /NCGR_PEP_ID=MMETSP0253-20130528/93666_1 /TAXON_ID=2966 /ORGANISM="Noctiluca scintillans" /LENGTH=222 /DNA_ID=CAMNT_0039395777 /DNA_START=89 /DNA_END=757 /DNA_ORIENTATION=+
MVYVKHSVRPRELDLSDAPEVSLHSALSSANRLKRCEHLNLEVDIEPRGALTEAVRHIPVAQLETMFPMLDPVLARTLYSEAPSPQAGIDILLALASSATEVQTADGDARAVTPPVRDLGLQDVAKFPSLRDCDGWEVIGKSDLAMLRDVDGEWVERARWGSCAPDPPVSSTGSALPRVSTSSRQSARVPDQLADYDLRRSAGLRRTRNRVRFHHDRRHDAR